MLLHDSRRAARSDKQGKLVTLEEQDRSLWDQERIREGVALLHKALRMRRLASINCRRRFLPFTRKRLHRPIRTGRRLQ